MKMSNSNYWISRADISVYLLKETNKQLFAQIIN